ncbi:histone acetyltransferase [Polyrhizophydium stewartii]|uniref:histone acetyltransferase n=1 Tax=Polyrhizophydium stewartii TaxID=2732419 RepID=A0ABR4MW69_9FUNG
MLPDHGLSPSGDGTLPGQVSGAAGGTQHGGADMDVDRAAPPGPAALTDTADGVAANHHDLEHPTKRIRLQDQDGVTGPDHAPGEAPGKAPGYMAVQTAGEAIRAAAPRGSAAPGLDGSSPSAATGDTAMDGTETPAESLVDAPPPQIAEELVAEKLKNNRALQTEREGLVSFRVVCNDSQDDSMILLTGLKNIYQKQLPNMPKEYIARLVYDKNHHHMAVVRKPLTVLGGITYRPFEKRNFAEIVFCAITSTEQVQGYGSRLMSHVKDYVRETYDIWNFLTYADNYAVGYFKKQVRTPHSSLESKQMLTLADMEGFTTNITLEKHLWCTMLRKIKYLDVVNTIVAQRWAVFRKIKEASRSSIVYEGLRQFKEGAKAVDPLSIPGLKEAGWTPGLVSTRPAPRERGPLYIFLKKMVTELKEDDNSWPFLEPVAGVPDYYDIIKEPMDIGTLEKNVEADKYSNSEQFYKDVMLIFSNCRTYNEDSSPYARCATRVEKTFKERFKILKAEMRVE